jgi:hypothetical protein
MMQNSLDELLEQRNIFRKNFTSDAWQLSNSFFINLTGKFTQFNIPAEKQRATLEGILEYFEDFVTHFEGLTKINYSETLKLLHEIGSPSEILQMMDVPLDVRTHDISGDKPSNKALCPECEWLNDLDSNYCDNCGTSLIDQDKRIDTKTVLPQVVFTYPNGMSLILSAVILSTIGLIEALITFTLSDFDNPMEEILLIGILVMFFPSILFGLILGRILEASKQRQHTIFASLQSPALTILFSYSLLLGVGIVEGMIIYIYTMINWAEIIPILLLIMVVPALVTGIFLAYINTNLSFGSPEQSPEKEELSNLILTILEHPYISLSLISYLVLLMLNILISTVSISPFFTVNISPNLNTYYSYLRGATTNMSLVAIITGFLGGFIITNLRTERIIRRKRGVAHLTDIQNKFSLGIVICLISLWLYFIFLPISLSENEITYLAIFLILTNLLGSFFFYKWNLGYQPIQIPYLTFLRKIKLIESKIYRNFLILNILGGIVIVGLTMSLWGTKLTWTMFTLPGWVTLIVAGILLLNGGYMVYAFSWRQIGKRLIPT